MSADTPPDVEHALDWMNERISGIEDALCRLEAKTPKLRDYFAAAALTGLLNRDWIGSKESGVLNSLAHRAYEIADAMLDARAPAPSPGQIE